MAFYLARDFAECLFNAVMLHVILRTGRIASKLNSIARICADDKMAVAPIASAPRYLLLVSSEIWNGQVCSFRFS
ncbi:hypothetical protein AC629_01690 [Bradyrhizobium sp. NAS80.1]|nr:hypothetical protein AC629_01690 [Bradyrhizobium sp. NAS80.1]